ncbi:MAG: autotransporter-associated beta strand repeat-containing protein [Candidatus Udaeobacter sp.]
MRAHTQTFKRHQPHNSSFGLFLILAGALLLPAAVAPRANAGSTDYWDVEDPLGSRPRPAPELFSQPNGVLINQPLASDYNPNLALNVAPGGQPGGVQPFQVDADASWTGANNSLWSNPLNWTAGGPPTGTQTATFDASFTGANQPQINANTSIGDLHMATGVTQNVTISASAAQILTINGEGIVGQGVILIDNTNAFTLTIDCRVALGAPQTWTNNSGNLFTVSGATLALGGSDNLTVNGTGDTLISAVISGGMGSDFIKDGTGTLTITALNTYDGDTIVDGGTLLVNGSITGMGDATVNSGGTLGGTGTIIGTVTVNAGGTLAPGNGGNNTGILTTGALTMAPASNFRIDINGTTPGTGYDQINVAAGGVTITGSNLVVTVGTSTSLGQTFTILNKTAPGAITGTFAGIPQGGTVTGSNGTVFSVSYTGGTGNDIVLTVVQAAAPEPSTWMGGALAIAGLAFTQRRRLKRLIAFSR